MRPDERLAEIITALEAVGLTCLVLGGHAVRYYGVDRNTVDYDLHLAPPDWQTLPERLAASGLFAGGAVPEGPSWRPQAFRRFQVGRLPDGREEWLEFWCANHLLLPFPELYARREVGPYGGRPLPFLSLPDLIRSKETERNTDWQDVALLEEILDARLHAAAAAGRVRLAEALAHLRSRRGLETYLRAGPLPAAEVGEALARTRCPITQAYLLPFARPGTAAPEAAGPLEPVLLRRLQTVTPGSTLHLTLVEAVRRQYKLAAQLADRADKQAVRAAQARPP